MNSLNIAANIVGLRKEKGVTQEEPFEDEKSRM